MKNYKYILNNLACAHCASKIEDKIKEQSSFDDVKFAFATKKLQLKPSVKFRTRFTDQKACEEGIRSEVQLIADSIEDGVVVIVDNQKRENYESKIDKSTIIEALGALAILIGSNFVGPRVGAYIEWIILFAYVVIGRYVAIAALNNLKKGRIFDENFLMLLATIGALVIGDYKEALGVMLFYRIGSLFEERAMEKSREEITAVMDMRPEEVRVIKADGSIEIIEPEQVEIGTLVQVRVGDRIPLDGVVIDGSSRIDTSAVTGESKPRSVTVGDQVLSGCVNKAGVLQIRVEKALEESFVTKILESVENASANKPQVARLISRFAKYYTPVVLVITGLAMTIPPLISGNWEYWFYTGLTFLVVSCPCAIVLSVPLTFFAGIGRNSKQGILCKGGKSIEALKNVKVIALDKTGTITEGVFEVANIETTEGVSENELIKLTASAERDSTHPIAHSIRDKAINMGLELLKPESVVESAGQGIKAQIDGKLVICGNRKLMSESNINIPTDLVLEDGVTEVLVASEDKYCGRLLIKDKIKADAKDAISKMKKAGYKIVMVTGDRKASANAVAKEVGIDEVHAQLLPVDKLNVIKSLKEKAGDVLFVGDGINDAPVLASANVGAAMGSGADAALEASDIVFMNSNVSSIAKAIESAKKTVLIAWENIWIALGFKVLVMILGLLGHASLWMAIFADTGVLVICVLNAIRLLNVKKVNHR